MMMMMMVTMLLLLERCIRRVTAVTDGILDAVAKSFVSIGLKLV